MHHLFAGASDGQVAALFVKADARWASFASRNRVKKLVLGSRSGALGSKAAGVRRPHRRRRPMGHHHHRCLCFPRTFVLFL